VTEKFIFWAQALDNASSDYFDVRGDELSSDDSVRRQEAVSLVSSVITSGTRIYEVSGILLTENDRHFVLEVPSVQLDRAGRTAPIICYGDYDATVGDTLGASAAVALDDFAKRIGRTLQPEHFELVRNSFEFLKKKYSTKKLVRKVWILAIAILAISYWMAQMGW